MPWFSIMSFNLIVLSSLTVFLMQLHIKNISSDNLTNSFTIDNASQKMKFLIKDFFIKCDQILSFLQIWSHLMKKSLMKNFTFCVQCKMCDCEFYITLKEMKIIFVFLVICLIIDNIANRCTRRKKTSTLVYKSKSYLFQRKIILQHHLSVYLNLHMLVDEKNNLYFKISLVKHNMMIS